MKKGISKKEILSKLPELPSGSFRLKIAEAGIKKVGERKNKKRPHITENLYPSDSVARLREHLAGR